MESIYHIIKLSFCSMPESIVLFHVIKKISPLYIGSSCFVLFFGRWIESWMIGDRKGDISYLWFLFLFLFFLSDHLYKKEGYVFVFCFVFTRKNHGE